MHHEATITLMCDGPVSMKGIMKCLACKHEWPFATEHDHLQHLGIALPGEQSNRLHTTVPSDIREDVQEAERANYNQCYKACVTMCRRALQLALIDKDIKDKPLSVMLDDAEGILDEKTFAIAKSIKGFGDIGAHRRELLEPEDTSIVIYMTVKMLNELFP